MNPSRADNDEDIALLRPLSDDPESLILCPTEGDSKEILTVERKEHSSSSAVLSVVESRLKTMLANIAVIVFESLQKEMRVCEGSRFAGSFPPWLITAMKRPRSKPSDEDEANSANPSLNNSSGLMILTKKVLSGRLRKFMGDLCLQVCSPVDAIHQYTAAVTESRATLDLLWLASALEGYAAAVLTLLSHKPSAGALYISHSTLYTHIIQFTLSILQFAFYTADRYFAFHILHLTLHTSHYTLHTSYFILHTSYFILHTTHFTFHTTHFILHTSHFILHSTHFILHTLYFTLHTSHYTLHTSYFTLHTLLTVIYVKVLVDICCLKA